MDLKRVSSKNNLRILSPKKQMAKIVEKSEENSGSDGYASNISSVEIDEGL